MILAGFTIGRVHLSNRTTSLYTNYTIEQQLSLKAYL
jgi:hypothetical protein